MSKEKGFTQLMSELEALVTKLEKEDQDLEDALADFEKGVGLFRECQGKLQTVEARMKILREENDAFLLADEERS